jgi:tetratricopeptide (TPR) repeat protein
MGGGFFTGILIGLISLSFGMQAWWFLSLSLEGEITLVRAIFLWASLLIAVWISFTNNLSLLPVPLPLLLWWALKFIEEKSTAIYWEKKRFVQLKKATELLPQDGNGWIYLGDFYLERKDFQRARICYKKAEKLLDMPWVTERIRLLTREEEIAKGQKWICSTCSYSNSKDENACKNCGESKLGISLWEAAQKSIPEMKKIAVIAIFIILLVMLIIFLPLIPAIILFLLVSLFIARFFLTF